MSASKLLLSGTTGLLRLNRAFTPLPPVLLAKQFPPQSLRFRRLRSSVAADTAALGSSEPAPEQTPPPLHPWPEWVTFVDSLRTQGYLIESQGSEDRAGGSGGLIYKEMNLLKDPCVSFARDRYDLFKLLSSEDIQAVVEAGCPNILRKVVNSAKRLRAHLQLDEGDGCGSCNLRGSCDRAYVVPKDSEPPRTVDVMRVLMFSAMDPLVISGDQRPPGRGLADVCARKLLSKMVELSSSSPTPAPMIMKQTAKAPSPLKKSAEDSDSNMSSDVEMRRGDWMCSKCNFLNFKKNSRCLKCRGGRPEKVADDMKEGDWICSKCNFMNFARNRRCLECTADGPVRVGDDVEKKKGDWNCPHCNFMNFASNKKCKSCRETRPPRQLNPGEWECSRCDFLNFSKNEVCRKCKSGRPRQGTTDHEEQLWKRPY